MPLITENYRDLNAQLHRENLGYGSHGKDWLEDIERLYISLRTTEVLDYGCGKSTLSMHIPFMIQQYDPAIPRFSDLPKPSDVVVCTDVLEHIEPECINDVLDHIAGLTKKVFFCVIGTSPAKKLLPDGRNAHQIIQPAQWWANQLWAKFDIVSHTMGRHGALFTCVPKGTGL